MLDGWNKTLDILLIFAGLFSAVATAFVIESYQQLDTPSHDAYVATALYLLVAASNVSVGITLPPPPGLQASAPELARWINGLWFTSLLLSLSVRTIVILHVDCWFMDCLSDRRRSPRMFKKGGNSEHEDMAMGYNLKWWSRTLQLPEIHIISACYSGHAEWFIWRPTSVTRIYMHFGCYKIEAIEDWSNSLPGLTHVGLRNGTRGRDLMLRLVTAQLQRPKLQRLSLQLHTFAPDMTTTPLWKRLQSLGDPRLVIVQSTDAVDRPSRPMYAFSDPECMDLVFSQIRDIFRKYVSGQEDPWA